MTKSDLKPIKDVTVRFEDVNPYDRLYENEHGYVVKVRITARPQHSADQIFEVTAAWADDKTGKARLFDNGDPFKLDPMEFQIKPDGEDAEAVAGELPEEALARRLEKARLLMVIMAGRAIANHVARQALGAQIKN